MFKSYKTASAVRAREKHKHTCTRSPTHPGPKPYVPKEKPANSANTLLRRNEKLTQSGDELGGISEKQNKSLNNKHPCQHEYICKTGSWVKNKSKLQRRGSIII